MRVIVLPVTADCQSVVTGSILSTRNTVSFETVSIQRLRPTFIETGLINPRGLHYGKRHGKEKRNQEKTVKNQEGKKGGKSSEKILKTFQ
jgi:hypothetical protein